MDTLKQLGPAMMNTPAHEHAAVAIGRLRLDGLLSIPADAHGTVIFAHGSGSSRSSPRNARVAQALQDAGFATLLFDLLTEAEAADRSNVFDVHLLGSRLLQATKWATEQEALSGLPVGYFGASTGAAAALIAAAARPPHLKAVVSRGGRPDLAGLALAEVAVPTLLIVGGEDPDVLQLNRQALKRMACLARLSVVPGATHLFEEPGALEQVITQSAAWFASHLVPMDRRHCA